MEKGGGGNRKSTDGLATVCLWGGGDSKKLATQTASEVGKRGTGEYVC